MAWQLDAVRLVDSVLGRIAATHAERLLGEVLAVGFRAPVFSRE
jgi:hypothetical protein